MQLPAARWALRPSPTGGEAQEVEALGRRLEVPELVAHVLWQRGLNDEARARDFLKPKMSALRSPSVLPDVEAATARLARAVRQRERIAVCGDYDVDGMTGTALLVRFFRLAGADVVWAIPDRDEDGYGLSDASVERLAAQGVRVAVTVDNGTSAHGPIALARTRGIDVVITDHHLPGDTLPDALAIVNPSRRNLPEPADGLGHGAPCGCALAFKLAWAVADRLRHLPGPDSAGRFKAFLRDAMGLVALATIADVVSLAGENRVLVAHGLQSLRQSAHPGLQALLAQSNVGALPLTTEDVAFRIAPRLNAAGRLSRPDLVIDLLTTEDPAQALALARELSRANEERKRIERGVLDQALPRALNLVEQGQPRSLVVHGEGWHKGVIGIVAARLVDLHQRPTVVIGFDGEDGRGSCRTSPEFDLHRALTACDAHLTRYGGHAMAAGLEIERGAVQRFAERFEEAIAEQTAEQTSAQRERRTGSGTAGAPDAPGQRVLWADLRVPVDAWTLPTAEALLQLAPFGAGNPEPRLLLEGVRVGGKPRLMGEGDAHLSFALKQTAGAVRVVGFRRSDLYPLVSSDQPLDVLVAPAINEWRGVRTAELRLIDARPHVGAAPQRSS